MKHTIFTVALCSALFAGSRNETVIVNPEFEATDADYLILSRIERTDTATVVYAGVYHLPGYWIYLSSKGKLRDSKGKTYRLLDCTGFQLDKEVYMPESGTVALALSFEPVDRDEKVVDYIDLDENNETITGIKLYKVKHAKPEDPAKVLPWVHIVIGNVKRLLPDMHHQLKREYLQYYLNGFCYKFNRRYFDERLFDRLAFVVVAYPTGFSREFTIGRITDNH